MSLWGKILLFIVLLLAAIVIFKPFKEIILNSLPSKLNCNSGFMFSHEIATDILHVFNV